MPICVGFEYVFGAIKWQYQKRLLRNTKCELQAMFCTQFKRSLTNGIDVPPTKLVT